MNGPPIHSCYGIENSQSHREYFATTEAFTHFGTASTAPLRCTCNNKVYAITTDCRSNAKNPAIAQHEMRLRCHRENRDIVFSYTGPRRQLRFPNH